jgi:hypothetical protein
MRITKNGSGIIQHRNKGIECTFVIPDCLDLRVGKVKREYFDTDDPTDYWYHVCDEKYGVFSVTASYGKYRTPFIWLDQCYKAEEAYKKLINDGWEPDQARLVLPYSLAYVSTDKIWTEEEIKRSRMTVGELREDLRKYDQQSSVEIVTKHEAGYATTLQAGYVDDNCLYIGTIFSCNNNLNTIVK